MARAHTSRDWQMSARFTEQDRKLGCVARYVLSRGSLVFDCVSHGVSHLVYVHLKYVIERPESRWSKESYAQQVHKLQGSPRGNFHDFQKLHSTQMFVRGRR